MGLVPKELPRIEVKRLGYSSSRYGPCEVCGKHVAAVCVRRIGVIHAFGHHSCLDTYNTSELLLKRAIFLKVYHGRRGPGVDMELVYSKENEPVDASSEEWRVWLTGRQGKARGGTCPDCGNVLRQKDGGEVACSEGCGYSAHMLLD